MRILTGQTVLDGIPEGHTLFIHAALPDGRQIVVTRHEHARYHDEVEHHRLFLGPPEDIAERKITHIGTFRDGGSIEYDLEGGGRARFVAKPHGDGKPRYASWLREKAGDEVVNVTVLTTTNEKLYVG